MTAEASDPAPGRPRKDEPPRPGDRQLSFEYAFVALLAVPIVAAAILLVTLLVVRDEEAAVAIPIGSAIGFVVVVAASVALSAIGHAVRARPTRTDEDAERAAQRGLSMTQGIVLLLTFVILTATPAGVVVGATTLLRRGDNLEPQYALPVILIAGLIGLLAVLASVVAVFRRFNLVSGSFPLGLPEGSIQAVIALGLILIFAIIGVYLHGSAGGEQKEEIGTQLLTTVSTLVVAVAGFYFGSKTTKEAADSAVRARDGRDANRENGEPTARA